MEIKTIGVVGAGYMGGGIAQVASMAGLKVILYDIDPEAPGKAKALIEGNFNKLILKGSGAISVPLRDIWLSNIRIATSLKSMAKADLVVEAAFENTDIKLNLFRDLEEICRKKVILASNTSSISIAKLAERTSRADKVIGMHFMGPVPIMQLVEVVRHEGTSEETVKTVTDMAKLMKKTPVVVNDRPGFVVNRALMPMINEGIILLHEGVADRDGIDTCMKLGAAHPMGPLTLADLIGLDVCLAIMQVLHDDLGDKYAPCPLLEEMVDAGKLGRKTKEGFYTY